jgi:hypothetical protein
MKAITLWQPWASWIAWGWKTIETRRHMRLACLVGQRIAIHAGKHWSNDAFKIAAPWLDDGMVSRSIREATKVSGAVLCTAFVCDANGLIDGDSDRALCDCGLCDLFGISLREVVTFERPIPAVGHQGIWEWMPPIGLVTQ